jgi:small multidrug resistance family-3 protein
MRALGIFAVAAVFEIAGCFAFWLWLRKSASPWIAALGVLSLIAFATVLARTDVAFAGRAYAAYGGVYIVASLLWLWAVEGQRPTAPDSIGAALAIAGALVIVAWARR